MSERVEHKQGDRKPKGDLRALEVCHEVVLGRPEEELPRRSPSNQTAQKRQHERATHLDLLRLARLGETEHDVCSFTILEACVAWEGHILHPQIPQL